MKRLMLFGFAVILLGLGGCGQQGQLGGEEQKAEFPGVMVGSWEAEVNWLSKWRIKFEPDGSIKNIIHSMAGPVDITEGGVAWGVWGGGHNTFAMGPCEARYIPKTHVLRVKIILDHFVFEVPNGSVLEGGVEDYFEGPVSEDGKTWTVEWINHSWLEKDGPPDPNDIATVIERLTFTKLDEAPVSEVPVGEIPMTEEHHAH